ncbi:proline-rich proteoglycan 2-like [Physeter macrocephalus]|uniref:Proline-rich proteoglycan 2-like n=1 Tax=Physeter macrocephalus TaxID=9755 RepID=A0A2Y9SSV6_PHYMC|nr:proline-rich proteoglycan 2-like [Physeter catodon]|eukprot:XP_023980522.1 proline-rich proteoglycan 2-like [Physeter catodon]
MGVELRGAGCQENSKCEAKERAPSHDSGIRITGQSDKVRDPGPTVSDREEGERSRCPGHLAGRSRRRDKDFGLPPAQARATPLQHPALPVRPGHVEAADKPPGPEGGENLPSQPPPPSLCGLLGPPRAVPPARRRTRSSAQVPAPVRGRRLRLPGPPPGRGHQAPRACALARSETESQATQSRGRRGPDPSGPRWGRGEAALSRKASRRRESAGAPGEGFPQRPLQTCAYTWELENLCNLDFKEMSPPTPEQKGKLDRLRSGFH